LIDLLYHSRSEDIKKFRIHKCKHLLINFYEIELNLKFARKMYNSYEQNETKNTKLVSEGATKLR